MSSKLRALTLGAIFLVPCFAQQWEIGASGLFGFAQPLEVTRTGSAASVGFADGFAVGAVFTNHSRRYLSGEIRYMYRASDLKLSAASGPALRFPGESHAIHYDFLLHARPLGAWLRPFAAFGGGVKVFRGTGEQTLGQPFNNFATLTRTRELTPLLSLGGGLSVRASRHFVVRAEFRDYVTPFPQQLIVPAAGARIRGVLHDLVPLVGVGVIF